MPAIASLSAYNATVINSLASSRAAAEKPPASFALPQIAESLACSFWNEWARALRVRSTVCRATAGICVAGGDEATGQPVTESMHPQLANSAVRSNIESSSI